MSHAGPTLHQSDATGQIVSVAGKNMIKKLPGFVT